MESTPTDAETARAELARLLEDRGRAGRVFYTVVPGLLALGTVWGAMSAGGLGLGILAGGLGVWSLGTAVGLIPAPAPSARYYPKHDRIKYLEGFLAEKEKPGR
jgi:hypothetical protein